MHAMSAPEIIAEIQQYCAATGLKPSSVCQKAFQNPHYLDRLVARMERLETELARFRRFKAENPPPALPLCVCGNPLPMRGPRDPRR